MTLTLKKKRKKRIINNLKNNTQYVGKITELLELKKKLLTPSFETIYILKAAYVIYKTRLTSLKSINELSSYSA